MAIQFTCPKCNQKVTLTASQPGDWIDCPGCDATVQIPGASPPKPAPRPAASPPRPARKPIPTNDFEDEDRPKSPWADKRVQVGAIAGALALLVVGLLVVVLAVQKPKKAPDVVQNEPTPVAPQPKPTPPAPVPTPVPPKKIEPTPVEPKPVEPKPVEPKPVEPKPIEPKPVEGPVVLDQFGNPVGQNLGLAKQNEFKGQRLLLWCGWPENGGVETPLKFMGPNNPLWKAFEDAGFTVRAEFGPFKRAWLKDFDQLWVISGRPGPGYETLSSADYDAVEEFVKGGKGVCLLADNEPYYVEADELARRFFGVKIRDNYPGTKIAYIGQRQLTADEVRKYKGDYMIDDHPLLTGVNFVYEGITISNVSASDKLEVVMQASNKKPVVVASKAPGLRVVIDCGFTRYMYHSEREELRFITKTAGSTRLAQNVAAYLAGKTK